MKSSPVMVGAMALTLAAAVRQAVFAEGWQFEVGMAHQWGMQMHVCGNPASLVHDRWSVLPGNTSRAVTARSEGKRPGSADVAPQDDITQYADRTFEDGFVRRDVWTEDPFVPAERAGTTWNWGYNNAGQYNAGNLTLAFHRHSSGSAQGAVADATAAVENRTSREVVRDDLVDATSEACANGLEFTARRRLWQEKEAGKWLAEINFGLAWMPDIDAAISQTPFLMIVRQNTSRVNTMKNGVYAYSANFVEEYIYSDRFGQLDPSLPPLPDVVGPLPYNGPADPNNGPGPLLPNLPDSRTVTPDGDPTQTETTLSSSRSEELIGAHSWEVADHVGVEADMDRLRLAFGPTLSRVISERLRVYATPRLTLNVIDISVHRKETVTVRDMDSGRIETVASRHDHSDKTDLIAGLQIAGGADLNLSERWFVGGRVGKEWLTRKARIEVGPDNVQFDFSDGDFACYLGRSF